MRPGCSAMTQCVLIVCVCACARAVPLLYMVVFGFKGIRLLARRSLVLMEQRGLSGAACFRVCLRQCCNDRMRTMRGGDGTLLEDRSFSSGATDLSRQCVPLRPPEVILLTVIVSCRVRASDVRLLRARPFSCCHE